MLPCTEFVEAEIFRVVHTSVWLISHSELSQERRHWSCSVMLLRSTSQQ